MLANEVYVEEGESVFDKLKQNLKTTFNFAEDNSKIQDCYAQIERIPKTFNRETTYIVLSVGGNDIINSPDITKSEEKLKDLQADYVKLIKEIKIKFPRANLLILNIYKPVSTFYKMFYNVIDKWNKFLIETKIYEYEIVDVEKIINSSNDFVNDIEPSEIGGAKIANEIMSHVK